jgi:hypothetical protein
MGFSCTPEVGWQQGQEGQHEKGHKDFHAGHLDGKIKINEISRRPESKPKQKL